MQELTLDDPVTQAMRSLMKAFNPLLNLLEPQIKTFSKIGFSKDPDKKERDQILRSFVIELQYVWGFEVASDDSDGNLPFILTHFDELKQRFEATYIFAEAALLEFYPRKADALRVQMIESARPHFDCLKFSVAKMTPLHLALQNHIYSLVLAFPNLDWAETELFFKPLFELRNRYFKAPQAHLISEYLLQIENFTAEAFYELNSTVERSRDPNRAYAESDQLTLEVAVLMEELA